MLHRPRQTPVLSAAAGLLPATAVAEEVVTGVVASGAGAGFIAIAFLLVAALLARHKTPRLVQRLDALLGRRRLAAALAKARVRSLERCVLPGRSDSLTRVDCAVATSAGIVCLRVLHGNGAVFGRAQDPQWSRVRGIGRSTLLNPLIQNEGRVRAVERLVPDVPVRGLVVFTGSVDLAGARDEGVLHVSELAAWLDAWQDDTPSIDDPDAAWLTFRAGVMTDDAAQRDFEAELSFG